ncbi:unnamed protein product [Oreochromis niloticus]|nr:unnamed protein product [Mustela putorius furo]
MVKPRWNKISSCLILMFQVAVSGNAISIVKRVGDDVILPCPCVTDDLNKCDKTTWTFSSKDQPAVDLITLGKIGDEAKTKSDRLSVRANCSLLIKKLTVEDVGRYRYKHCTSAVKPTQDFDLSVVSSSSSLRSIIVLVGLAALITAVVMVNIWARTKGNKTQMVQATVSYYKDKDEVAIHYETTGDSAVSV